MLSSPTSFQFLFSPPRSFSPMETPPSLPSTLSAPLTRMGMAPSTSGSSSVPCLSPPGAPLSRNSTGPSRCTTWMGMGRSHAWRCWRSLRYWCFQGFAFSQVFHRCWVLFSTKFSYPEPLFDVDLIEMGPHRVSVSCWDLVSFQLSLSFPLSSSSRPFTRWWGL